MACASGSTSGATATSGSARRRSRRSPSASSRRRTPAAARRRAARARGRAAGAVDSPTWRSRFPPVAQFLERWRSLLRRRTPLRLRPGGRRALARRGRRRLPRAARAAQAGRDRDRAGRAVRADKDFPCRRRKESLVDRPLRLITTETPVAELARTIEALLVVASQPLPLEELAGRARGRRRTSRRRARAPRRALPRGTSGIVLEHVAGGWAFRASRDAAEACARLFERPVEKGLSQAALETLAIVAYLGPCSRPEIARIRGVNVDGVVAGLVERGLIAEGGPRDRVRRDPLPHDAALRARLRARVARRAAARRRPRRRRDRDPRAARGGRREAPRLGTRFKMKPCAVRLYQPREAASSETPIARSISAFRCVLASHR